MDTRDPFGVQRPDLITKAEYDPVEARRQRRKAGGLSLIPVAGGITGAGAAGHYAPEGHKAGAFGRAYGRATLEGLGGGLAGRLAGTGVQAATKGKLKLGNWGGAAGSFGGVAHGTSASVGTTQRRYGTQPRRPKRDDS